MNIKVETQTLKPSAPTGAKKEKVSKTRTFVMSPEDNTTKSPFFVAYIKFLALAAQLQSGNPEDENDLDPNEKALLEMVVLRWSVGKPCSVRQAIAQVHLGSPATLHKRLMRLRAKEYMELQDVSGDRRVKCLVPGPKGLAYIEAMGQHLMSARRLARKSVADPA